MSGDGIAVDVRAAGRSFAGRDGAAVRAVDDVSLSVARGAFVALAGPSGSGKSTLLALVGALDLPTSGSVAHDGRDLGAASEGERARLRRRIGFVLQSALFVRGMTLWENVTQALVPRGIGASERRALAEDHLARLGLAGLSGRRPDELSGGERQRAAVARALVVAPRLVVADEPTSQLDAETARAVVDALLAARREGATVVVASHDPAVLGVADVTVTLACGRVVQRS
jgi:putative ABC transport system ATP-binding protein